METFSRSNKLGTRGRHRTGRSALQVWSTAPQISNYRCTNSQNGPKAALHIPSQRKQKKKPNSKSTNSRLWVLDNLTSVLRRRLRATKFRFPRRCSRPILLGGRHLQAASGATGSGTSVNPPGCNPRTQIEFHRTQSSARALRVRTLEPAYLHKLLLCSRVAKGELEAALTWRG